MIESYSDMADTEEYSENTVDSVLSVVGFEQRSAINFLSREKPSRANGSYGLMPPAVSPRGLSFAPLFY